MHTKSWMSGCSTRNKKPLFPIGGRKQGLKFPDLGLSGCFPTQGGEREMPIQASELNMTYPVLKSSLTNCKYFTENRKCLMKFYNN